nr:lipoprotein insertase outer membrane protein LolB [Marinobacter halotolerans]
MIFRIGLLALLLSIAGCASIDLEPLPEGLSDQQPENWPERIARLNDLTRWKLAGKLAVRQPSDSGTAIINHWKQSGNAYDIGLSSSFLGMGSTRLEGTPGFITLTLPSGDRYQSGDPEALVEAATGWQLPLGNLTRWIKGLPGTNGDYRLLFNDQGQLALIRQQGWEIRYDSWNRFLEEYPPLPARLTAVKGEKRVRLVVSDWQLAEGSQP